MLRQSEAHENRSSSSLLYNLCSQAQGGDDHGWDVVQAWIQNNSDDNPNQSSRPGDTTNSRLETLKALVTCQDDEFQRIPLHLACMNNAPETIISWLLEVAPETSKVVDSSQSIPLHYYVAASCSSSDNKNSGENDTQTIIQLLLDANPMGKTAQDEKGWTPIHHVLVESRGDTRKISTETIKLLLDSEVAATQDKNGRTPLHLACHYSVTDEDLAQLVVQESSSADVMTKIDDLGRTPLHIVLGQADKSWSSMMLQL
jgi:ankyrin repeat protein